MSIELGACKFCGAKAVPNYYCGDHWVTCPQCKVGTATFGSAERAAASWNRRAQPAEEVQPVGMFWQDLAGLYHQVQPAVVKHYPGDPGRTPLYTRPPAADADRLDAELLDFVEANPQLSLRFHKKRWSFVGMTNYEYEVFKTAREAIAAALAASKEKKE